MLKRILTVQDISCVGKCSLTVALPVISALGVECSVLPTAVLSTHTAGFGKPHVRDLTPDFAGFAEHWERLGLKFDAVYSGYLGDAAQIDLVRSLYEKVGAEGSPLIVDPAMADYGKLYSGFDMAFVEHMRGLCAEATIVLPNVTEAALITGEEFREDADETYVRGMLEKLCAAGAKSAVITGVVRGDEFGAALLDGESGEYFASFQKREHPSYHGTGDIFASVVAAGIARGRTAQEVVAAAVGFVVECIRASAVLPEERRYGSAFELKLGVLTRLAEQWSVSE